MRPSGTYDDDDETDADGDMRCDVMRNPGADRPAAAAAAISLSSESYSCSSCWNGVRLLPIGTTAPAPAPAPGPSRRMIIGTKLQNAVARTEKPCTWNET